MLKKIFNWLFVKKPDVIHIKADINLNVNGLNIDIPTINREIVTKSGGEKPSDLSLDLSSEDISNLINSSVNSSGAKNNLGDKITEKNSGSGVNSQVESIKRMKKGEK